MKLLTPFAERQQKRLVATEMCGISKFCYMECNFSCNILEKKARILETFQRYLV